MEALAIKDTLLALKDSAITIKEKRTITCTAKAEKIEKDWAEHILVNQEACDWRASRVESESECRQHRGLGLS